MVRLSPTTQALVERTFSAPDLATAIDLLETDCAGNLPLVHAVNPEGLERIRFAAIRASAGNLDKLVDMIALAQQDWRDLLVLAGFAESTTEHTRWARRALARSDNPPS